VTEDDDLLVALGRVVIASGKLEHEAYAVALSLGLFGAPKRSVTGALKLARKKLDTDPPPWCTLTVQEFDSWRTEVVDALEQRNQLFHSAQVNRMATGEWQRVHLRLRDGSEVVATPDAIAGIAKDLADVHARSPMRSLLLTVRPGVYWRMMHAAGYSGGAWIYYSPETGSYPNRPTDEEIDEWWRSVPVSVKDEWHNWIIRQSEQATEELERGPRAKIVGR